MNQLTRSRLIQFVATPFTVGMLGCLLLAGWAVWSAGLLDGPVARDVRTSSVYAAAGTGLDEAAAERIIGNRRLVVVLLEPGADLEAECGRLARAAAGTVVLLLSVADDEYDTWGCSQLADSDEEGLGRAVVAESVISRGTDALVERPLETVKAIVLNYDLLVSAGTIPPDSRTVSPSLPRYLLAAAAVLAVLVGTAGAYLISRRAGALTARHLARREAVSDSRRDLSAATSALAHQLVELDRLSPTMSGRARRRYEKLAAEYPGVLDAVADSADLDEATLADLTRQVGAMTEQARTLAI